MSPDLSIKPLSFRARSQPCLEMHIFRDHFIQSSEYFSHLGALFSNNSYRPTVLVTINLIALGLEIRLCKRRVLGPRAIGALAVWFQDQALCELLPSKHRCNHEG